MNKERRGVKGRTKKQRSKKERRGRQKENKKEGDICAVCGLLWVQCSCTADAKHILFKCQKGAIEIHKFTNKMSSV